MSEAGSSSPSGTDAKGGARNVVAVRIAGHEYKIRSDGNGDALREIAGYVDRAMARVRERTGTVDSLDVAVLTCLNLAREILGLREERAPEGAAVVEKDQLRGLIERIEALVPDTIQRVDETLPSARPAEAAAEPALARTLELPNRDALREEPASDESEVAPRAAGAGGDRAS